MKYDGWIYYYTTGEMGSVMEVIPNKGEAFILDSVSNPGDAEKISEWIDKLDNSNAIDGGICTYAGTQEQYKNYVNTGEWEE